MKKQTNTYNNPYATNGGGKIDAPVKQKEQPKSSVITPTNARK